MMDPTVTYAENLGKLACGLACQAFFGDDVLVQSSLHGNKKRGLSQLDPVKNELAAKCSSPPPIIYEFDKKGIH